VKAFYQNRMKRKVLLNLLMKTSEVLEINSLESVVPLGLKYLLPHTKTLPAGGNKISDDVSAPPIKIISNGHLQGPKIKESTAKPSL
jgi:hypothetical protein